MERVYRSNFVWMTDIGDESVSVSRLVAVDAMRALGLDPNDFRTRDKIIMAISGTINAAMDTACGDDDQTPIESSWLVALGGKLKSPQHIVFCDWLVFLNTSPLAWEAYSIRNERMTFVSEAKTRGEVRRLLDSLEVKYPKNFDKSGEVKKKSTNRNRSVLLGQLYTGLCIIRDAGLDASDTAGRCLEQRDVDEINRIAAIANGMISRVMSEWDAD